MTEPSVILLKKHAANCSNQVRTVRELKLLPTHEEKHYFVVSTPCFSYIKNEMEVVMGVIFSK